MPLDRTAQYRPTIVDAASLNHIQDTVDNINNLKAGAVDTTTGDIVANNVTIGAESGSGDAGDRSLIFQVTDSVSRALQFNDATELMRLVDEDDELVPLEVGEPDSDDCAVPYLYMLDKIDESIKSGVRQTFLTGSVDGNGAANFLSIGSGLSVNIAATSIPLNIAYANGFGLGSPRNYKNLIFADTSVGSLTASSTCYIYHDFSSGWGHTVLAPVYDVVAPSSPSTDQHWFDINAMRMFRWSGSAWVAVARVFAGQAVTGASTVSAVTTYALAGVSFIPSFGVTVQTNYAKNHNIGVGAPWLSFQGWFWDGSNWCHNALACDYYVNSTASGGFGVRGVTATALSVRTGYASLYTAWSTSSVTNFSGGNLMILVRRGF